MINISNVLGLNGWSFVSQAEADSSLRKIVRGHLNLNLIARNQSDVVLSHLAADVSDNTMTILKRYLELGVRQCFHHRSLHLDNFLLSSHKY
jgi:hypothetical protein